MRKYCQKMIRFYLRLIRFFSNDRLGIEYSNYGAAVSGNHNLSLGRVLPQQQLGGRKKTATVDRINSIYHGNTLEMQTAELVVNRELMM